MTPLKVKDLMIHHPVFIAPKTSLKDAAIKMKEIDCGVLPVGTHEKLEGIITDRDLVIRALINGNHHGKAVQEFMTPEIIFCYEDDSLEDAAQIMKERKVNRLMVRNKAGKYTGLLSFGDTLLYNAKETEIAKIIKRCGNQTSQKT